MNIFEDPEVREALKTYSNWPTFPQLYVNGELVGGCDITLEMYKSGELKTAAGRSRRGRRLGLQPGSAARVGGSVSISSGPMAARRRRLASNTPWNWLQTVQNRSAVRSAS